MDDRIISFLVLGWVTLASKERQASSIGYPRINASSKQLTENRNAEEVLKVFQQAKARDNGGSSQVIQYHSVSTNWKVSWEREREVMYQKILENRG